MRRALVLALTLVGCSRAEVPTGAIGSSLALVDPSTVAVVDPDVGSVSFVDAETLAPLVRVEVGDGPRALLAATGLLYVAVERTGELVELATDGTPRVLRRQAVCAGPRALARTPGGELMVACGWDGTVRGVDPVTLAVRTIADGLDRPVAVAAAGDAVLALERGGRLLRVGGGEATLVPAEDRERPALAHMVAHDAAGLAFVEGGTAVAAAFELVNPTGEGNGEAVVDDYGSLVDGRPKINPALRAFAIDDLAARDTPATYARYDAAPSQRCNGPSAIVALDDAHLLVTHRSSADLAVVALDGLDAASRLGDVFHVGAGPAGVALDAARRVAWVDAALDGAISRVDLGSAAVTTRVRDLPASASPLALEGRRTFFDATNAHLSPAGVVACATCHPEGGDDGLAWFIRAPTIPAKRRLTPDLANAGAMTAPYHWDGALPDRATLVQSTVVNLMAGDGLLVDGDAVAAYIDELVRAPVPPAGDPGAIARGQAAFTDAGCASCHPPPLYTDRQRHAVLPPEPDGPDALPMADTPALRGLFLRRAFLHDGRSPSLEDLLGRPELIGHQVSDDRRADLIAFLRSL